MGRGWRALVLCSGVNPDSSYEVKRGLPDCDSARPDNGILDIFPVWLV